MAANGDQPFIKVTDTNGKPIVAAILHIYEVGTTTNRAIYSDAALSVPISNPLSGANASNASGDFPRFYMAAGVYKLRAERSDTTLIWEWDNIDTGTTTGGVLPIASGGTGAITAPAALTALGAAAASDVTALAAQIAAFSASLTNIVSQPQGRLTPTSGAAVISSDALSKASIFYTPYIGNLCPIWNGSTFISSLFAELTLDLSASHTLSSIFDCFIINDSGTIRIVTGPAWTTIAAGSGARGTGGGTTELVRQNGILVNANAMPSARNGASTYSVAALQGTYVGSLFIDTTAGQVTCHTSYGQSRKFGVWNAYNRVPIIVKAGDATSTWTIGGGGAAAFQALRNATGNSIIVFSGLPENVYDLSSYLRASFTAAANQVAQFYSSIGVNSTSTASGPIGTLGVSYGAGVGGNLTTVGSVNGRFIMPPSLGVNVITALEAFQVTGAAAPVANGTEAGNLLTAGWMG